MHQPRLQNETFEAVNASTSSQDRGDRELTDVQRNAILQALLQRPKNRILKHGAVKDIAQQFDFKIPHMSKQKLEREGRLPVSISCSTM